jgi:hypothetical protein
MTVLITRGTGNIRCNKTYDLADSDAAAIYDCVAQERSSRAYIYEIRVDAIVRYIGKGSGRRMYTHLAEAKRTAQRCGARTSHLHPLRHRRLVDALRRGAAIAERIIISGLSDRSAAELERMIIALFHRDRTGQLWNTVDERFMDQSLLPAHWQDPPRVLYRVARPKR